jgi:hypothetical protein
VTWLTCPSFRRTRPVCRAVGTIYIDNSTATFMLNAGIGLAKYLQTELEQRGSVLLRNNTDAMVIVKDQLRSLTMRTVTN